MTVKAAMLEIIRDYNAKEIPLTMSDLEFLTFGRFGGKFTRGTARRTAQELVAEGVLRRIARGIYRVNWRRLAQVLRKL